MKTRLLATLAFVTFAAAGAAFAATDLTGTVKSVDPMTHTITLADGSSFAVDEGIALDGYRPGDKVMLSWVLEGTTHQVVTLAPAAG